MILRPYQRESVDCMLNFLSARDGSPCIVLPTGAGKSIVIAEIARHVLQSWPGTRICCAVHTRELVRQNAEKLLSYWPEAPVGIYSAGLNRRDRFERVIFGSIQSIADKADYLGAFNLVLVDEAHRIPLKGEGQYRQFLAGCRRLNPNVRFAGLTATAYRLAGGPICGPDNILTDIAYEARVADLIRDGYLTRLVSKAGIARADLSGVHTRNGEYVAGELERAVDKDSIVEAACGEIMELCADRKAWIVFCAGVKHADHVRDVLAARGVACATIEGGTPKAERDEAIARFQRGELRALCNVNVLTEGFDATHVDAVVMLRPTKSAGLYYQMCGRGMRLHPGKADCLVLDFAGNIVEHGPVDAIRPPKRPNQKVSSAAPVRECPRCHEFNPIQARVCQACGYEWPIEETPKHEATASNAAILSDELAEPEKWPVYGIRYSRHEKPGKPPSMCVTYTSSNGKPFYEWVCIEHGGLPRARAMSWWMARDESGLMPQNVDAALGCTSRLRTPSSINVVQRGKYPEIVGYEFESGAAGSPEREAA